METSTLLLLTLSAFLSIRFVRNAWTAPYRPFRWAIRATAYTAPPFLAASWLELLTSGPAQQLFAGFAIATGALTGLASLGMLIAMATAPSRRR